MNSQGQQQAVTLFHTFTQQLAEKVRTKTQAFFLLLLYSILLAIARRRTVTTWLHATQISNDYRSAFYHLSNIGHKSHDLLDTMTSILAQQLRSVRRPSHADRRNFLRRTMLENELKAVLGSQEIPKKIIPILKRMSLLTP